MINFLTALSAETPGGDAVRVGGWQKDWRQRGPYRRGAGKAEARGVTGANRRDVECRAGGAPKRLAESCPKEAGKAHCTSSFFNGTFRTENLVPQVHKSSVRTRDLHTGRTDQVETAAGKGERTHGAGAW